MRAHSFYVILRRSPWARPGADPPNTGHGGAGRMRAALSTAAHVAGRSVLPAQRPMQRIVAEERVVDERLEPALGVDALQCRRQLRLGLRHPLLGPR